VRAADLKGGEESLSRHPPKNQNDNKHAREGAGLIHRQPNPDAVIGHRDAQR
jgi:hypothetical protein